MTVALERRLRLAKMITRPMTAAEVVEMAGGDAQYRATSAKLTTAVRNDLRDLKACGRLKLGEAKWYPANWQDETAIGDGELRATLAALGVLVPADADRRGMVRALRQRLAEGPR